MSVQELFTQIEIHLVLLWTALLYDIGKPSTTKLQKERLVSYNHDIVEMAEEY